MAALVPSAGTIKLKVELRSERVPSEPASSVPRASLGRACHLRTRARAMIAPHYISENKSDIRGIKPGWYVVDNGGKLVAGPFSSREKCVERSFQPMSRSTPSALR
jgi:hypothetical protein